MSRTRRSAVPLSEEPPQRTRRANVGSNAAGATRVVNRAPAAEAGSSAPKQPVPIEGTIEINKIIYRWAELLSDKSGEADIFKITDQMGQPFVLKRYKSGIHPKENVLRTILNLSETGVVTRLFDYGKIPYLNELCDYELMEYVDGGTLRGLSLQNDMARFVNLTRNIAAALELCHQSHIIHNDIKPDNIFLRRNSMDQIVLGDFGISSFIDDIYKTHRTINNRTQEYAPPEKIMSNQNNVSITPAADYYSLGIMLMELWQGREVFAGIDDLEIQKCKLQKNIPGIDALPPRVKTLIEGLTVVSSRHRWGYRQLIEWAEGRDVPVHEENLRPKMSPFIFDSINKLTANTTDELARLIVAYPQRAKVCIYDQSVSRWLEQNGYKQERDAIERLVELVFPRDQLSGIQLSANVLGYTPYIDPRGRECYSLKDIAESMMNNEAMYERLISSPNNTLFEYMRLRGLDEYIPKTVKDANRTVWKLIYTFYPQSPFCMHVQDEFGTRNVILCETTEEVLDCCCNFTILPASRQDIMDADGKFMLWLDSGGNSHWANLLRLDIKNYSKAGDDLFYLLMYRMGLTRGYYFHSKDDRSSKDYFKIQELGELYNEALIRCQNEQDENRFLEAMAEFLSPNHRLHFYLIARNWEGTFQAMRERFNRKNSRYTTGNVVYDPIASAYSCGVILLSTNKTVRYPAFQMGQQRLNDINRIPAVVDQFTLTRTNFISWLKCFYQEDPTIHTRIVSSKGKLPAFNYAYDEFLEKLYTYLPTDALAKRYHDNRVANYTALNDAEKYKKGMQVSHFVFTGCSLTFALLAMICCYMKGIMLTGQLAALNHLQLMYTCFSMLLLTYAALSFAMGGLKSLAGGAIVGCVLYFTGFLVLSSWVSIALMLVGLILTVYSAFHKQRKHASARSGALMQTLHIDNVINDALHSTFNQKSAPQVQNKLTPMRLAANLMKKQLTDTIYSGAITLLVWILGIFSAIL